MQALEQKRVKKSSPGIVVSFLVLLLDAYQKVISPLLHASGSACRFHPTCSEYTRQVLIKDGLWKGFWRALRRISKCHPFHAGGMDHP